MLGRDRHSRMVRGQLFRLPYMINCREFEEFVQEFYDGELPEHQLREFRRHLRVCPECRVYLAAYRTTVVLGRSAFTADSESSVPSAVPADLIHAILAARASPPEDSA